MKKALRPLAILISITLGIALVRAFVSESHLVRGIEMTSWNEVRSADCAVVLTGGPNRLKEGFDLLARGDVKKVIVSGVNPDVTLREIFPHWAFYSGLREEDIVLERQSMTTFGNAYQTLLLVHPLGCRDLLVVTSRVHMHRALKTFSAVFPKDFPIYPWPVLGGKTISPRLDEWISETLKSLGYRLVLLF